MVRKLSPVELKRREFLKSASKNPEEKFLETTGERTRIVDYSGKKFTKLTVAGESHRVGNRVYWYCICECGKVKVAASKDLKRGIITSCGCVKAKKSFSNELLGRYKSGATYRGLSFELSRDEFHLLTTGNCYYCGSEPRTVCRKRDGAKFRYNGVDRKNNGIGYTKENSVSCCKTCNISKNKYSDMEFIAQSIKIAELHCGKKLC